MNEIKSNVFNNEISKNLVKVLNNLLKIKPLIITLKNSQIELQNKAGFDLSTSDVIEIGEEKLNACANGCQNIASILNDEIENDSKLENFEKTILHPLDGAMSILIVIQDSLKQDALYFENKDDINNNIECVTGIESNIDSANMIWNLLNEQVSETLYENYYKLEKELKEELVIETN